MAVYKLLIQKKKKKKKRKGVTELPPKWRCKKLCQVYFMSWSSRFQSASMAAVDAALAELKVYHKALPILIYVDVA